VPEIAAIFVVSFRSAFRGLLDLSVKSSATQTVQRFLLSFGHRARTVARTLPLSFSCLQASIKQSSQGIPNRTLEHERNV
jgi:hypothetical protein